MRRVPSSTYRLQLNAGFTFEDAARVAGYLKALGISHVYSSPYLQAAPGSMHGYDVVDHQKLNEELGGEEGHKAFCRRLSEPGRGTVVGGTYSKMARPANMPRGLTSTGSQPKSSFKTRCSFPFLVINMEERWQPGKSGSTTMIRLFAFTTWIIHFRCRRSRWR
jgi:hypothetical protein